MWKPATGMKRRLRRVMQIQGLEHLQAAEAEGRGIILLAFHFLTLEVGAAIFTLDHPGVGFYRPNKNLVIEWLQFHGRTRGRASLIAKITNFNPLILGKADQMARS